MNNPILTSPVNDPIYIQLVGETKKEPQTESRLKYNMIIRDMTDTYKELSKNVPLLVRSGRIKKETLKVKLV